MSYQLTKEGEEYLEKDLPEARLLKEISLGKKSMRDLQKLPFFSIGFMWAKKNGWISVKGDIVEIAGSGKSALIRKSPVEAALESAKNGNTIDTDSEKILLSRKLIEEVKEKFEFKEKEIAQLTPEIIKSGVWRSVPFRKYDAAVQVPEEYSGRKHILRMGIDTIKRILVEMGFKEMEGTMIDAEFFVNDCLFMPQDHPARTHWDQFSLKNPKMIKALPQQLVKNVKAVHESGGITGSIGWGYEWSGEIAKKIVLRGHTTSLTTHYLMDYKNPPQRFFSVDKVFRNDTIDKTHLLEFYQIEGWVMDSNLTIRDLMGTFREFYGKLGIKDLKFKPVFNPYTEPSFEIFGRHPKLGKWLEIGNSGMFREEMLQPFGITADVIAWGLALERTLMLLYNYDDIRNLHGTLCDIDFLRKVPVLWKY